MLPAMERNGTQRIQWGRRVALATVALVIADIIVTGAFHARSVVSTNGVEPRRVLAVLYADTPPAFNRTRRALDRIAELYRAGGVKRVVCIGGNRPSMRWHAGPGMRANLLAAGIPGEQIVLEEASYDTRTNMASLGKLLREWGENSALVVVYPAHQWRVSHHARRIVKGAEIEFAAPRADYSWDAIVDTWSGLHHEAVSWLLLILLSEQGFDRLVRHLRG
jgi:uncharacterized SAM-binding protein YcdF (DUF218 family)